MSLTPRQRRLGFVVFLLAGVSTAVALALSAFEENLLYFYPPADVVAGDAPKGYPVRMGGLVADGSVQHAEEGLAVRFAVTDGGASVPVVYKGVLPDLFREGQGVVVRGTLSESGLFTAEEVLAKHDENYMPPEVADALDKGAAAEEPR